ncbi:MAG TPA: Nif3-like dinuclear metal center hexameric protein [Gemmatimonadaceae bacterium]|nr:Nif3-like dinuclear metal center hexameric protein [Gemmatimonadaceae bacterium]
MAALEDIVGYLDGELRTTEVPDYDVALNGLQLGNRSGTVERVACAVDFSANTVDGAIRERANLLVVHHGMFWRGQHALVGRAYRRLAAAIAADLAVYASHIPLDLHPVLGNNVLLARELSLTPTGTFGRYKGTEIGVMGTADAPTAVLLERLRQFSSRYATTVVHTPFAPERRTRKWAIITGAGASPQTLAEAAERGIDTFVVGEGAHHTAVDAIETGLVVMYAGHYATETLGVRAVLDVLEREFRVSTTFVDVPTGL